jgi:hypothetical protein
MAWLSRTAEADKLNLPVAMQELAARGGPTPLRQLFGLLNLRLGPFRAKAEEYYTYALWRPDRGRAFRKDFLSNLNLGKFNSALKMPERGIADAVLDDKVATEALLLARGLPVTRTRALYPGRPDPGAPARPVPDLPGLVLLHSAAEVAAYLADPAHLPVFGKPRAGRFAYGAAMIEATAGPDRLRFMTGEVAPAAELAAEILRDWPGGYVFQPFYRCEAALRRHTGAALASVRIVTLWTDRGIEPWYAVIRVPAKTAMHDGDADDLRIWGLIDLDTGRIAKLRSLRDPLSPDMTHAHDPATPFLGFQLPHWTQAVDLCRAGHENFPGNGIIGWDVFLTDDGALLNEANVSPGHVYQVAAQRPLLNPDLRPAYERALAFARKHGGGGRAG